MSKIVIEPNHIGGKHDSSVSRKFKSIEECEIAFKKIETVFFNLNLWNDLFNDASSFQMLNSSREEKNTPVNLGDVIKIQIPGPKNKLGKDFDWIEVKELEKSQENNLRLLGLVLSPTTAKSNCNKTAHFYTAESKNYFIIRKTPYEITAEVHGRDETANLKGQCFRDKIRNFLVAKGGIFGFSKIHWKTWCTNILDQKTLDKDLKEGNYQNN